MKWKRTFGFASRKSRTGLRLVCQQVIEHNVNLFSPSGMVYQLGEKVDELNTGVTLRGLALHLARLDIQCGVERQSSVPIILKSMPFGPSRVTAGARGRDDPEPE